MPALLLYLLQVNGALLLFYAGYGLVLRRLTFYTLNRCYLLFAVGFSAAYPLVDVGAWLARPVAATTLALGETWTYLPAAAAAPTFTYWIVVEGAYWVGVGLLLMRLLMQLAALYRIRRASQPAQWQGQQYRRVGAAVNPFSFGRTIYLNPDQHAPAELPAILRHEQVHVRQWHTLDVLVAQLAQAFCWFNPGAWLLRRAVQENLEFITDRAVLRAGLLDAKAYQYSLLKLSTLAPSAALANHFTFLTLKNRIAMMNKKRSATAYLGLYALLVPGLALFTLACSKPQVEPSIAARNTDMVLSQEAKEKRGLNLPDNAVYFLDGKEGDKSLIADLELKKIARVDMFKGEPAAARFGMGGEGGVVVVTTKANQDSEQVRAFRQKYNVAYKAPDAEELELAASASRGKELTAEDLQSRLLLVDGKEVSIEDYKPIKPINGQVITAAVLDSKSATEKYGAKGRNGVLLITTKK